MMKRIPNKREPNYTKRSFKAHKLKIFDNAMANYKNGWNYELCKVLYIKLKTEQQKPYNKNGLEEISSIG